MAGEAAVTRRDDVAAGRRTLDRQRQAADGRQARCAPVCAPDVRREAPVAVGAEFEVARFDRPAVRELLPELRATRETPAVRVAGVDCHARWQTDPAPLARP